MKKQSSFFKHLNNIILTGIICIAIGIIFILAPSFILKSIGYVLCICTGIYGLFHIFAYFKNPSGDYVLDKRLAYGLVFLLLSVYLLFNPEVPSTIMPYLFGFVLLAGSFSNIQDSLDLHRAKYKNWWVSLLIAVVSMILGIVIIGNPFTVSTVLLSFTGAALIFEGLAIIFTDLVSKKYKNL